MIGEVCFVIDCQSLEGVGIKYKMIRLQTDYSFYVSLSIMITITCGHERVDIPE